MNTTGMEYPYSMNTMICRSELYPVYHDYIALKYPKAKRIAIIGPDDETGWSVSKECSAPSAKAHGFQIVAMEFAKRGTTDYYALITKILSKKPDIIDMQVLQSGDGAIFLKQLYELGFRGVKSWPAFTSIDATRKIAGEDAMEGLLAGLIHPNWENR